MMKRSRIEAFLGEREESEVEGRELEAIAARVRGVRALQQQRQAWPRYWSITGLG